VLEQYFNMSLWWGFSAVSDQTVNSHHKRENVFKM